MRKYIAFLLLSSLLVSLAGCGNEGVGDTSVNSGSAENTPSVNVSGDGTDMFTDRDQTAAYDEEGSVHIRLNGNSIMADSSSVKVSGTTAVISDEGTYIISGTLNEGTIIVNAGEKDKPQIVLDDVVINNTSSAPICILEANKVFLTLAEGHENTLSNNGSFTEVDGNNVDGVIFSKQDLTLNGVGVLTVNSSSGHGIVCKDDLAVTGGTYNINSAYHGIDVNDSVRVKDAEINIDAGKDGIHSENNDDAELGFVYVSGGDLNISAEGDGISASSYFQTDSGSFSITSGGGSVNASKTHSDSWGGYMGGRNPSQANSGSETTDSTSMKGLKAGGDILIDGGSFTIDSADDGIHCDGSIEINGGSFEVSSGDDGVHADVSLFVNAGEINISESYEGFEGQEVSIAGGDVRIIADDDGINAAGGIDSSGFGGFRQDDSFKGPGGGAPNGPGGHGGGPGGNMGGDSSGGSAVISGGNVYINASGDGIDANGSLEISGGFVTVCGPTVGDTATLDYDTSGVISGGTFIGTGAFGMAQTFSDSTQGVIAVRIQNQEAGTKIVLTDSDGGDIISYTPELSFEVVILSTPELEKGKSYVLTVGAYSEELEAN